MEIPKECVTTHLPNELALKMDCAKAEYRYSTVRNSYSFLRVGGRSCCAEVLNKISHGTAVSADLGGSSNYSNEKFED